MATTFESIESGEESLPPPVDAGGTKIDGADETTPSTPRRRGRPPGSGGGLSAAKVTKLEEDIRDKMLEDMVLPGAFISPLVAANIEARAERTAKAVARIAAKNPTVRKSVERAIEGSDYLTIFMFLGTSAICAMVDWGMMHPNAVPARAANVPELWETVYPGEVPAEQGEPEESDANGFRRGLLDEVSN